MKSFLSGALLLLAAAVPIQAALPVPTARAAESVTLTLNFTPYGLHFGPVMAKARGLYAAAGLDVEILRGYGSTEAVKRTALGTTTFAMADAAAVVIGRDKGLATKQIATILDRSSDAVYFLASTGIKKPADLEGKTFGAQAGESHANLFPVFAKMAKFDPKKVSFVNMTSSAKIPSMVSGKIDAMMTFVTEEPTIAAAADKAGAKWERLLFSDYGVDNYSIGLIASDALMTAKPDLVRKFVNATMAGYALAVAEPEAAADAFAKAFPENNRDLMLAQWKIVEQQLVTETGKQKGLGYMTAEKMGRTLDMLKTFTTLEKPVAPEDVFTMEFLEPQRVAAR